MTGAQDSKGAGGRDASKYWGDEASPPITETRKDGNG